MVQGLGSGLRVQGVGFRVQGLGRYFSGDLLGLIPGHRDTSNNTRELTTLDTKIPA